MTPTRTVTGLVLVAAVLALPALAGAQGLPPRPAAAPGRIIVKVDEGVEACLDELARAGQSIDAEVPGTRLDALQARFGARRVRPLRLADRPGTTMAGRRRAEATRRARSRRRGQAGSAGAGTPSPSFVSTYVIDLAPGTDVREAARAYGADPIVEYAQPDWVRHATALTNDPYLSSSGTWGQAFEDLWGVHAIAAPAAWDVARGAGTVIAISDTGVDTTHPDLAANVWVNPGEIAGNGLDDDANGYVDDVNGWNFVDDTNVVDDDHGHGTHVAGTAAAAGDDGTGIVGIAHEARVMALKGLNAAGVGTDSDLAAGILYAVENGADVINASWGGIGVSPVLEAAVEAARAAGVVFVAAAGNSAADVELEAYGAFFPAAYPHAITVAASDRGGAAASFSNFGVKIDVTAPGGGDGPPPSTHPERSILSLRAANAGSAMTFGGDLEVADQYLRQAGTSMASPHVAGAAAVLLSAHPMWDPELVRAALRVGADDVGAPGWDPQAGYGRLNVAAALAAAPLLARITAPASGSLGSGSTLTVTGSAHGATFAFYTVDFATVDDPTAWTPLAGPVATPVVDGTLAVVDTGDLPDGQHYVRLRVQATDGTVFEDRVQIAFDRVIIASPERFAVLGGSVVALTGSVNPGGFQSYAVAYNLEEEEPDGSWQSGGIVIPGGGASPVEDGVLATLDTAALSGATHIAFRVLVQTATGSIDERVTDVIVDPAVREGWPFLIGYSHGYSFSPNVADVDGDGVKEILIAAIGHVGVFRTDGSYAPGWPQQLWNGCCPPWFDSGWAQPAAADMDGDGTLEIAITTFQRVFLFEHDGTLVDGWPVEYDVEHTDVVFADVDQDALPELVTVVDHGVGWGNNLKAELLALELDGTPVAGYPVALATGEWNPHMSVGDVTGDGVPEIAITYWEPRFERSGKMYAYLLDLAGSPIWKKPLRYGKAPWQETSVFRRWILPTPPALADLDGDGVLDVVLAPNRARKLRAVRGDGRRVRATLRMKLPKYRSDRHRDRSEPIALGDLTGDGTPEVVYATHLSPDPALPTAVGTDYLVAIDPTDRTPLPGWPVAFPYDRTPFTTKTFGLGLPAIGDIDGDGAQEVVVAAKHCDVANAFGNFNQRCDAVHAFEADGTPVAGFPRPTTDPTSRGDSQVAITDLDDDGQVELIWVDIAGRLVVWTIPGAGAPAPHAWPLLRRDPQHHAAIPPG